MRDCQIYETKLRWSHTTTLITGITVPSYTVKCSKDVSDRPTSDTRATA